MKSRALIWATLFVVGLASAGEQVPARVIKVENGANYVDIIGDGTPGLIVSGHRENFNAHSFDVVSFYVQADVAGKKGWHIVPVMQARKERLEITVSGGADCLLHNFRLMAKQANSPPTLVLADRASGETFADPASVVFSYFTLVHNSEGDIGSPVYAFELSRVVKAKTNYCDVDDAFKKELGLAKP